MSSFADLGLSPEILKAIEDRGYTTPTPIQEQAIPYVLQMRDVMGCAQTGTGKTAGFTLPMLEILANGQAKAGMPRALILEPTRELATQVAESFRIYGKYHKKLSMALLIGGETMGPQLDQLLGADVLIATPGRLLDIHERGKIMFINTKIFVIDEADRMLDMGFMPDIEKIAGLLPQMKQTLFFSATMAPEIRKLADKFLRNPKTVTVSPPASTAENVRQILIDLPSDNDWQKREALRMLIKRENVQNAFIFCNRKKDVALLDKSLKRHGFNVGALHGDLDQSTRTATLNSFRNGEITFLACSDVAARGLDIPDVSHVFNFDVPFKDEDYVHRIGRTGRAGKSGTAYTLVTPEESQLVSAIEALIKQKITREVIADLPAAEARSERRPFAGKSRMGNRPPRPPRKTAPVIAPSPIIHEAAPIVKEAAIRKPVPEHVHNARTDHPQKHGFGDHMPAFLKRAARTGK